MEIDRRAFIASLGGAAAVSVMDHEARADALEDYTIERLDAGVAQAQGGGQEYPTGAELEAGIETRSSRRGVGRVFVGRDGNVSRLPRMPANPTLQDFFELRFAPANHVLQSATRALKTGMSEEVILACLLHDTIQTLMKADHGWWGAQLYEPYVPEKTSFAIRYHQALRFYADSEAGYEYPESYFRIFGTDYQPPPHIEAAYKFVRNHKWYMGAQAGNGQRPLLIRIRMPWCRSTRSLISSGDTSSSRKEGLGNDNSSVAHMWPDHHQPRRPALAGRSPYGGRTR